jgi:hypothetical protein
MWWQDRGANLNMESAAKWSISRSWIHTWIYCVRLWCWRLHSLFPVVTCKIVKYGHDGIWQHQKINEESISKQSYRPVTTQNQATLFRHRILSWRWRLSFSVGLLSGSLEQSHAWTLQRILGSYDFYHTKTTRNISLGLIKLPHDVPSHES